MASSSRSAISLRRTGEMLPEILIIRIGNSATLISVMTGSSASVGISALARSTFARTSLSASAMSTEGRNSAMISEMPSALVDVSSLSPFRPASSFSILIVTDDSMSSGATPW